MNTQVRANLATIVIDQITPRYMDIGHIALEICFAAKIWLFSVIYTVM
jgi:hypothetical protein